MNTKRTITEQDVENVLREFYRKKELNEDIVDNKSETIGKKLKMCVSRVNFILDKHILEYYEKLNKNV